jgi:hypothetical protein
VAENIIAPFFHETSPTKLLSLVFSFSDHSAKKGNLPCYEGSSFVTGIKDSGDDISVNFKLEEKTQRIH